MHSKGDDIEVIGYDNPDESVVELLDLFFSRYQIALKTQMSGNDFYFGCVNLLYYKFHKKSFNFEEINKDLQRVSNIKPLLLVLLLLL